MTAVATDSIFAHWRRQFLNSGPKRLQKLFWHACESELKALKPGNVHMFGAGHGMRVEDFLASALAVAPVITDSRLSLGERILDSVRATQASVSMNTNLGVILLCAPIALAAERQCSATLKSAVADAVSRSRLPDAESILQAIRIAAPSGLASSPVHDVHEPASADILTIMKAARGRDMIARQYANGFAEIFEDGCHAMKEGVARGLKENEVITGVFLKFLSHYQDTHIRRQHGEAVAEEIKAVAGVLYRKFLSSGALDTLTGRLMQCDTEWKARDINPGTSADLTVATIFAHSIENAIN